MTIDGCDIIGALLRDANPLLDKVVAERIRASRLPDGIELPALLVRGVSSVDRQSLKRRALVRRTDRVAVTVRAASDVDRRDIIALVRQCCAGRTGNLGGGRNVSILTAGTGPDVNGPGDSYEKTQDFRVSWDAED